MALLNPSAVGSGARAGTLMALCSMLCVQLGLAVSVELLDTLGPTGVAWLRLADIQFSPSRARDEKPFMIWQKR